MYLRLKSKFCNILMETHENWPVCAQPQCYEDVLCSVLFSMDLAAQPHKEESFISAPNQIFWLPTRKTNRESTTFLIEFSGLLLSSSLAPSISTMSSGLGGPTGWRNNRVVLNMEISYLTFFFRIWQWDSGLAFRNQCTVCSSWWWEPNSAFLPEARAQKVHLCQLAVWMHFCTDCNLQFEQTLPSKAQHNCGGDSHFDNLSLSQ